jgi:hypothetical protein
MHDPSPDDQINERAEAIRRRFPHAVGSQPPSGVENYDRLKNLAWYALYALIGALVAALLRLGVELGGDDPIQWRAVLGVLVNSFAGTLATAIGTATLTRYGSEGLASTVNAYRALGYRRSDLTVIPKPEGDPRG